jgi:serine/threonine protein kinase
VQAFHALAGWNHNDIKLDNLVQRGQGCLPDKVLCTETGKFKMVDKKRLETAYCLIDFDRAEPETSRETSAGRDVGTIYYTPIEVILGLGRKPSSGAGDLFRFGIASLIALVGMRNYEIMRKSLCNCEFHSSFKEEIDRKGKDMLGDILLELWPQPQDKDRNTAVRDELLTSLYVYLVLTYEESCMFAKYLDNVRSVQNGGKESDFFQKFLKTNDMFKWHSGLYSLETGTEMEVIRDSKIFKENVKTRSAKDRNYKCSAKEEERPALKFFKGLLNPDPGLRYPGWKAVTLLAERTKLKDAEQEVSWSLMNILKRSV